MAGIITLAGDTDDVRWIKISYTSWADCREGNTGSLGLDNLSFNGTGVQAYKANVRGVGLIWTITRSFYMFDTSSITHVPKQADLGIKGITNGSCDIAVLKGSWNYLVGGLPDYGAIEGWGDGAPGDNINNVTHYADQVSTWSTSGYNNISLNQQALVDIAGEGQLQIALISWDNDLRDVEPGTNIANASGVYYTDNTGTASDPRVKLTLQDDAVFMGANF